MSRKAISAPWEIGDPKESAALLGELDHIIDGDRYPFSPRIRSLTGIRDQLRPPPVRAVRVNA